MEDIAIVRTFNRTVTHRIGALDNHFLGRARSLGASRVLFEIGSGGVAIRELRTRLGLDSGYMSRLLRSLEREGLVRVARFSADARSRSVTLTRTGKSEVAALNRLSDRKAASILEPLTAQQQERLLEAMAAVDQLLRAGAVTVEIEDPRSAAARGCVARYYEELAARFEHGFDPEASISAVPDELTPPKGYFVIARAGIEAVGCGALKCHPELGEIKRMWVDPSSRGLGVGRRILLHLEGLARKHGLGILRLETNKSLVEAQAMYRSCGYREVAPFNAEPYAHHWFEKKL